MNKYFHMIPLWKFPIKLPVELPVRSGPRCGQLWPSLWPEPDLATRGATRGQGTKASLLGSAWLYFELIFG